MDLTEAELHARLDTDVFPLSSKYDPRWVLDNEMGPNALWLTEWLCDGMDLEPKMHVLDLGCGRALSSIFLAREFGVHVWAVDLWIRAEDNMERIRAAGLEDQITPIQADAHRLPFTEPFFDAILSVGSYHYYGTCDLYLRFLLSFLRPCGLAGIVVPGLMRDFDVDEEGAAHVPEYLTETTPSGGRFWDPTQCFSFHTVDWWRRHWMQTGLVDVEVADTLERGWKHWLRFAETKCVMGTNRSEDETPALIADHGRYLGFVRMLARKRG